MTSPTPLQRVLRQTQRGDRALDALLREAARDASARIRRLAASESISSQVRMAQLALVRNELLQTSASLWGEVDTVLAKQVEDAASAAAEAAIYLDRVAWNSALGTAPAGLAEMHRAGAIDTARQYQARTANGIPLSTQVYGTQRLADGFIDGQINTSLLLGESWKELADRVRDSILPNVKGGVAYAAKRLGRTEINNAFHQSHIDRHKDEPWVSTFRWNLSGSHPKADTCDEYANETHYQGGQAGHYQVTNVPKKPHPQCLCYITAEAVDEDEFVNGFLRGDYDRYLDEKLGPQETAAVRSRVERKPAATPALRRSTAIRRAPTLTPEVRVAPPIKAPVSAPGPVSLEARYAGGEGVIARQDLTGGVMAEKIEVLTFKDGTRAVLKQSAFEQEAATELAYSRIGRRLGAKIPEVARLDSKTVLMEYVEDKRGIEAYDLASSFPTETDAVRAAYRTESGRSLGLVDTVLQHQDRHALNWMVDEAGDTVGIDNGMRYIEVNDAPNSPFAKDLGLYQDSKTGFGDVEWVDNAYTPADWDRVREAVRSSESELRELPVGSKSKWGPNPPKDGFEAVMRRIDEMAGHARGTSDKLPS